MIQKHIHRNIHGKVLKINYSVPADWRESLIAFDWLTKKFNEREERRILGQGDILLKELEEKGIVNNE